MFNFGFNSILLLLILFSRLISSEEENLKNYYAKARKYSKNLEPTYSNECRKLVLAEVDFFTDATDEKEEALAAAETKFNEYQATVQKEINEKYPFWVNLTCSVLKKEFKFLARQGNGDMPLERVEKMNALKSKMSGAYSKVTMCEYKNPDNCTIRYGTIDALLRVSRDYEECAHYVTAFHNEISKAIPATTYKEFVELDNEAARFRGALDMGDLWMSAYDDESPGWTAQKFRDEIDSTWKGLKPFYMKLHAYARMKLAKVYGKDKVQDSEGHMPLHITSDMWAQDWLGIDSITKPYPNAPSLDATEAMKKAGYTVEKMFHLADEYYQSLGLYPMNANFWEKTMMVRPPGKEVLCHPVASDLSVRTSKGKNGDYRIFMCADVTHDYLGTIHHEMGHIEYQMHYSHYHWTFRNGANPGFHEAIGDSLALGVTTPKHLQCVLKLDMGLDIDCNAHDKGKRRSTEPTETDINLLYLQSLSKLVFLPFAYSVDTWRYDVFSGKITPSEYNDKWWQIRKENQGIVPPSPRPSDSFDAATKYHVVADVGYIRYFVSYILQFQFYEALCIAAGEFNPKDPETKPLYQCDIYGSKAAGKKLGDMLKLGSVKSWPDAMEILTGTRSMSPTSMLNYFKPLFKKIDEELNEAGESPCFGPDCSK